VRGGCPSEPEETGGQSECADDYGRQTFFWGDVAVVLSEFARESGFGEDDDD